MKILIISDTHSSLQNAGKIIHKLEGKIQAVFHLGDMVSDAKALEANFDYADYHYVGGNSDAYFSAEPLEMKKTVTYEGVTFFLTHGHLHSVKSGYEKLAKSAKEAGAQIAVCGHTHEPYCKTINGILVINPGSIAFPRGRSRHPSYAVVDITGDKFEAGIVEIKDTFNMRFF